MLPFLACILLDPECKLISTGVTSGGLVALVLRVRPRLQYILPLGYQLCALQFDSLNPAFTVSLDMRMVYRQRAT